jgi:hypothetical protein
MTYREIFGLCIQHGYNAGGDCPDLDLHPTADTQAKLSGHKMMWQKRGGLYQLVAGFDGPSTPLVPISTNLALDFDMVVGSPAFQGYTAFPNFAGSPVFYFHNVATTAVPGSGQRMTASAAPAGLDLGKAIGRVRISMAALLPLSAPPTRYLLPLEAQTSTWQYCILARPQLLDPVLEDLDNPGPFTRTALIRGSLSPLLENLRLQLAELYPDRNLYHFASPAPIAWRASGRKNVVLKDGQDLVLDHLANPSPTHHAMVFIHA